MLFLCNVEFKIVCDICSDLCALVFRIGPILSVYSSCDRALVVSLQKAGKCREGPDSRMNTRSSLYVVDIRDFLPLPWELTIFECPNISFPNYTLGRQF